MSQRYQGGILGVGFNPLQAPSAPTIGAASAGNTQVSVAFTAPANVGGSAISSYRVLANPGGIGATTSSSPATVSGLTNGTTYTFSVAAVNSYGFSPYSGTVSGTPAAPLYVENVFSTWLYTGNDSTQTITNGVNLSGQGGLVWTKGRSTAYVNGLVDTARGALNTLISNSTDGSTPSFNTVTAFTSSGFSVGTSAITNALGTTYASWTFREAPKFFDVVTYTGDGVAGRQIAHNLGSAPGMMIVKRLNNAENWDVYHRSIGATGELRLNQDAGTFTDIQFWNNTAPTASVFTVGTNSGINANGGTYVAYLFAHDAGGFGDLGTDSIISCGGYTGNGSATGPVVTLGWEPQWVMIKGAQTNANWIIYDNMRGMPVGSNANILFPNTAGAETSFTQLAPSATGFQVNSTSASVNQSGATYVYMAIRRGPMQVPTVGTSVFNTIVRTGTGAAATVNSGNLPDWTIMKTRSGSAGNNYTRLTGNNRQLYTSSDLYLVDQGAAYGVTGFLNTSYTLGLNANNENQNGQSIANWVFSRAPGFFDVSTYTGTGSTRTVAHNLGVVPELMFVKRTNTNGSWRVYTQATGANNELYLDYPDGSTANSSTWNNTLPTASVFTVGTNVDTNTSGSTYINYLFASAPGVSKVGSYTGNGSSQTINCAFTTGARFVLIKRTNTNGDWYVWDSTRGIVANEDPYLALNNEAAEVTNNDSVDTDSTGFVVNQVAASNVNVNGATYIFLAIS